MNSKQTTRRCPECGRDVPVDGFPRKSALCRRCASARIAFRTRMRADADPQVKQRIRAERDAWMHDRDLAARAVATNAWCRYTVEERALLLRPDLSDRQVAAMLKRGHEAVRQTRKRLAKRLGIPSIRAHAGSKRIHRSDDPNAALADNRRLHPVHRRAAAGGVA